MGVMLAPSEAAAHDHEIAQIAAMLQGHKQTNFGLTARSLKPFTGPRTPRWVSREIALGPRERLQLLHLDVPPHEFPDRIRVFGYFRGCFSNSALLSETHTAAMQGYRQGTAFTAAWSQRDFAIYAWTPIAIAILEHLSAGLTDWRHRPVD